MRNGIHFISGLPRAGSTLLAALLGQNPELHTGISSPIGSIVTALLQTMSQSNESAVFIDDTQREAILRNAFEGYYQAIHPTRTVIDTSRSWCAKLHVLAALFPGAKMICCVRELSWVVDSLERLIRGNLWEKSKIFDFDAGGTVYSRSDGLTGRTGMVGFAYNALQQAIHSEQSGRMMLLRYETLTADPAAAMRAIYEFLEIPAFEHDFERVAFDATEFDARLGTPGLHRIAGRVAPPRRDTILPPDLFARFENDSFWLDPSFSRRVARVV